MDELHITFSDKRRAFKERIAQCEQLLRLCDEIRVLEFKLKAEYEIELVPMRRRIIAINKNLEKLCQKMNRMMAQTSLKPATVADEKRRLEIALDEWLRSREVYWCSSDGIIPDPVGVLYDLRDFYRIFENDIELAERSIEIAGSIATARQANRIRSKLHSAMRRGVAVNIVSGNGRAGAIIDGFLCWEASRQLHTLRRFAGEVPAAQLRKELSLTDLIFQH